MQKGKFISTVLATVGIIMISVALNLESDDYLTNSKIVTNFNEINIKNMATAVNIEKEQKEVVKENNNIKELAMEVAPASVIIPPRIEVYEKMTIEELADKINRNLGSGYISGKGYLIATQCIEKGVDPYLAVSIILHETGCKYNCSSLVRNCNNVGGQKGTPSCSGSYKGYSTLDEGIIGFIDNLKRNYYDKGLTTVESIGPRYAQSTTWPSKINNYIKNIKES